MPHPSPDGSQPSGCLFIVATPIGNLEDITARARRVLSEVSLIACEDTRTTRTLLDHLGVRTPLTSFHDHNERDRVSSLLTALQGGQDVALVSDAGTPCIADPGYRLVAACREAGVTVCPIPGPCAAIAALSAAGLPVHRWTFLGFAPRSSSQRQSLLRGADLPDATLILYESPQRLLDLLQDVSASLGPDRLVCIGRELTKHFEEFIRGTVTAVLADLSARDRVRGECVVLIGPIVLIEGEARLDLEGRDKATALLAVLRAAGCTERTQRDALVAALGWRKGDAYRFVLGEAD
jgi:16S rRNA (cytidine1402-2'-O)-methyltransferase